jgi:hypothetical protein
VQTVLTKITWKGVLYCFSWKLTGDLFCDLDHLQKRLKTSQHSKYDLMCTCLSSQARYDLVLLHCQCNNSKPVLWFSPVIIPLGLYTHSSWGGMNNGPIGGCSSETFSPNWHEQQQHDIIICEVAYSHLSPVFVMDYDVICEVTLYVIFISTHKSDSTSVAETKGIILDSFDH